MNTYNITYTNTKDCINSNPNTYKESDLPLVLKDLNSIGYSFVTWIDENEQPIKEINIDSNKDRLLTAIWSEISILSLEYDGNANMEEVLNLPEVKTFNKGENVIVSTNIPVRKNYKFITWNTEKDGKGLNYKPGSIINNVNTSLSLYAIWEEDIEIVTLTFDKNTTDIVSNMPAPIAVIKNDTVIISNEIPTRNGYIFLNWNTIKDNTGIKYYPKQEIKELSSNLILYAIWYKIPVEYINCCTECVCICCGCRKKIKDIC